MLKVKITVLKKCYFEELAEEFLTDGKETGPCPLLNEGDVFIYEGDAVMPKGFCPWAWIYIYRGINSLSAGATFKPWNKNDGEQILCCTDGVRPVVFCLKAIEN